MVGIANNLTGMSLRRPSIEIALTNFICQKNNGRRGVSNRSSGFFL